MKDEKSCAVTAQKGPGLTMAQSVLKDLKSLRALWNYLFLAIYAWVAVYLVLYHADSCGTSVVYTTGGIVGSVFTNYCWSSHMDKRLALTNGVGVIPIDEPVVDQTAASAGEGDGNG